MVEIVINDKMQYDWKKTSKKLLIPVVTAMLLTGGNTLIQNISELGIKEGTISFLIAGLAIGAVKSGMNWYKNWYRKKYPKLSKNLELKNRK